MHGGFRADKGGQGLQRWTLFVDDGAAFCGVGFLIDSFKGWTAVMGESVWKNEGEILQGKLAGSEAVRGRRPFADIPGVILRV